MSTTNIGADDALWLDGNALAGLLSEVIGTDLMRVVRTTGRVLVDLRGSLVLSLPVPTA